MLLTGTVGQVYERPYGAVRDVAVTPPGEDVPMATQLTLIDSGPAWRLDDETKETGRKGLASARAALASHRPTTDRHPTDDGHGRRAA